METEIYQTDDISRIISFLQEQGLLNRSFRCHKCNTSMELKDRAAGDKKTWRCPKYSCQTFKSVRAGSWFDSNRIQLTKILKLIFAYVSNNTDFLARVQGLAIIEPPSPRITRSQSVRKN